MSETQVEPLFPDEQQVSEAELMGDIPVSEGEVVDPTESEPKIENGNESDHAQDDETMHLSPSDLAELEAEAAWEQDDSMENFKELSQDEFLELLENDPDEAAVYQHTLTHRGDYHRRKNQAKGLTDQIIRQGMEEIEQNLPDIYSDNPTQTQELARFAVDNGMDLKVLNLLTSPNVRIIAPGQKKATLLGKRAASLVRFIKNMHTKSKPPKKAGKAEAADTKPALEKNIDDRLTGLGSEKKYASLADAQRERYLRGSE